MMFDYLTYEELVPALTSPTSAGVQGTTQPADPLRVPGSRGVTRSVVGVAVATTLVGTLLLLVVAAGIFLKLRKRKSVAIRKYCSQFQIHLPVLMFSISLVPLSYDVGNEAQPEVGGPRRPRTLNLSYSEEQHSKPHYIVSHYNESATGLAIYLSRT